MNKNKRKQRKHNAAIFVLSAALGIFACLQIKWEGQTGRFLKYAKTRAFAIPTPPRFNNPPNPQWKQQTELHSDKLFVIITDRNEESGPHFCQMKRQWIDKLNESGDIEAIVVVSQRFWQNSECGITTLTIPPPKYPTVERSAWLLFQSIQLFLEHSNSGWLFLTGDSVYVKVPEFLALFHRMRSEKDAAGFKTIIGGCIEKRYFFQTLSLESGILLSRHTATRLLEPEVMDNWNVILETGISDEEALGHVADQIGVYFKGQKFNLFVGQEFRNASHFDMLMTKQFEGLNACIVPNKYIFNDPGEAGVCTAKVTRWKDVITWSGSGTLSKANFLEQAETMLNNNPPELGFYWDKSKPMLCNISLGSSDREV